jgi:membrane-associated protease RseP (regulator of RpoE activity)
LEREYKRFTFTYGIIMLRTRRGLSLMDRLGKWRITKPLAWFMLYLLPISGGIALYVILSEVLVFLGPKGPATVSFIRTINPLSNLLLPGINPYVPIVYGWLAIVFAIVIHESAHGIVARSLGLPVKSAGAIFLLFIPLGAFVEIDENQLRETKARNSLRVLAAGSGINFIVGLICLALLVWTVSAMVPAVNGSAVFAVNQPVNGSVAPAWDAGVRPGDFIIKVDGVPTNDFGALSLQPFQVINVTIWRAGQTYTYDDIKLGEVIITNIQTHQNTTQAYFGTTTISYSGLHSLVSQYVNFYSRSPTGSFLYVIPPAFPGVAGSIPFSDELKIFYTSPLGGATNVVQNVLFWFFFVNFNLAIFNNLPIYPMDGGQALERFLVGVGRGRISDEVANRVAVAVTIILALTLVVIVIGPYLSAYL